MASSYILFDDGSVLSCGNNEFGQLGDGTTLDGVVKLVQLDGVIRMLGVGPSAESVFFVTDDEVVWGTGLNDRGQLGTGDTDNREVPSPVQFEERVILEVLSASGDHTVAIGSSEGTFEPTKAPSVIPTEGIDTQSPTVAPTKLTMSKSPTSSETETTGTLAPTAPVIEAEIFYWGSSGSVGESANDILVPFDSDIVATDVSAGSKYTIVILSDGTAQTGGFVDSLDTYKGHLGVLQPDVLAGENPLKAIDNVYDNDVVITAPDLPFFIKAFAGAEDTESSGIIHSILLDKDGQAWATGSNNMGQLCLGDKENRFIPQRILVDGKVVSAAVGSEHTLLLLEDGSVYGCGSNMAGELGLGDTVIATTGDMATKIESLPFVRSVSAGLSFSLFTAEDGLYATGSNLYGQLCDGKTIGANATTPYRLEDSDPNVGYLSVDIVSSFMAIKTSSFILFNDGGVAACGRNEFGQLGDGKTTDPPSARTAFQLPDNLKVTMIGAGPSAESAFFISDDNQVWGTGLNNRGQLGVDDTENRNIPTPLKFKGPLAVKVLSAAGDHTVALGYIDGTLAPTIAPAAGSASATQAPALPTSDVTTNSPTELLSQSPQPTSLSSETDFTTNSPAGLGDNTPIPPTLTIVSAPPTSSDAGASLTDEESGTIVDIAVANEDLSTLVAAIDAAGLVETIAGEGPFTVFAPTNEAFSALPEGTVDSLLLPENTEQLQDILKYHVVAESAPSSSLESGDIETLNGDSVTVTVSDAGITVNDANVITADIMASNGVIHVIDKVLLPPEDNEGNSESGSVSDMTISPSLSSVSSSPTSSDAAGADLSMNTPTGVPTTPLNIGEVSQFPTRPPEEVSVSSSPSSSVS
jgi:uncharacterized surface protein with fasciclin (FAS1) repeats/alpha-tubulin suppressor-like RCC1 family protein